MPIRSADILRGDMLNTILSKAGGNRMVFYFTLLYCHRQQLVRGKKISSEPRLHRAGPEGGQESQRPVP